MGTLGIYSIFITKQQHLFWYVDTIKCYSIPSVPSGLEEVKTRPDRTIEVLSFVTTTMDRGRHVGDKSFWSKYDL